MQKLDHAAGFALALAVLAAASPARATRVARPRAAQLFTGSGAVVVGAVRAVDPACPGGRRPCTVVAFEDLRVVAGRLPEKAVGFTVPEGLLDDGTTLRITGAPRFVPGERYLLFLRSGPWFNTPVTGWYHGAFREVRIGPRRDFAAFVDQEGRAVVGLDEQGMRLGDRIAPPSESAVLDRRLDTARGRSGTAGSPAEEFRPSDELRRTLSGEGGDLRKVALPAEELLERIKAAARQYGLGSAPVKLAPTPRDRGARQATSGPNDPGAGPAEAPAGTGRDREQPEPGEPRTPAEPPLRPRAHPGVDQDVPWPGERGAGERGAPGSPAPTRAR